MQWFVNIVVESSKRKEWIWKMYKKKKTIKMRADHYISSSNGIESFRLCVRSRKKEEKNNKNKKEKAQSIWTKYLATCHRSLHFFLYFSTRFDDCRASFAFQCTFVAFLFFFPFQKQRKIKIKEERKNKWKDRKIKERKKFVQLFSHFLPLAPVIGRWIHRSLILR